MKISNLNFASDEQNTIPVSVVPCQETMKKDLKDKTVADNDSLSNLLLPPELQEVDFTENEKFLIQVAREKELSPHHVQRLQQLLLRDDAEEEGEEENNLIFFPFFGFVPMKSKVLPFERQAAKGLLARHGKLLQEEDTSVTTAAATLANYGNRFNDPTKQINLFENVLKMPLVSKAFQISIASACKALMNKSKSRKVVTIMDIGLGKGGFVTKLLHQLMALQQTNDAECPLLQLERVHVIGIDIDPDSLAIVKEKMSSLARGTNTSKAFTISCETIQSYAEEIDWSNLKTKIVGDLMVFSNFTLHHLKENNANVAPEVGAVLARERFFAGLATLQPILCNIVEPDSDHISDSLPRRLAFMLKHFRVIDDYLGNIDFRDEHFSNDEIRSALVEQFFGNEAQDIVAGTDTGRTERHEPYYAWQKRFVFNGFSPLRLDTMANDHHADDNNSSMLQIRSLPGVARFFCYGFPILSVLSFSCKKPVIDLSCNIPEHGTPIPRMGPF